MKKYETPYIDNHMQTHIHTHTHTQCERAEVCVDIKTERGKLLEFLTWCQRKSLLALSASLNMSKE